MRERTYASHCERIRPRSPAPFPTSMRRGRGRRPHWAYWDRICNRPCSPACSAEEAHCLHLELLCVHVWWHESQRWFLPRMRNTTLLLLQGGKNRGQGIMLASLAQLSEPTGIISAHRRSRATGLASTTNLTRTIRTRTSPTTNGSSIPPASTPYQTSAHSLSSSTPPSRSTISIHAHVYLALSDVRMEYVARYFFSPLVSPFPVTQAVLLGCSLHSTHISHQQIIIIAQLRHSILKLRGRSFYLRCQLRNFDIIIRSTYEFILLGALCLRCTTPVEGDLLCRL
ncbi:hypothetical protein BGZ61DRAFT_442376 [Ilyonectria robusta]|uniref:uncharacterized protein n=1 Tax=Ilyonectria robusta TaxID=1079257 RepID=UPI001E8D555B|nr:uncharacterized protein BGZ61DRAFT_442376 [Ilyonectria robusta]KAH8734314.1 hypothetical protein BGZ61DRAFT_442376 [Ilyonectria robusta]